MSQRTVIPPEHLNSPPSPLWTSSRVVLSLLTLFCACLALTPYLLNYRFFERLIWFGDDYDLLNQIRVHGFWPWTIGTFAENFVPLFKILWGCIALLSGGDYRTMIGLLWITHAANAGLLFLLLVRLSVHPLLALGSVAIFALASSLHETLGWSVQWSAILCTTFFLLTLIILTKAYQRGLLLRGEIIALALFATCSVFSFSRGLVVCGALSIGALLGAACFRNDRSRWLTTAFLVLIPACTAAALLFFLADGNHQKLLASESGKLESMLLFGATSLSLNPFNRTFGGIFSDSSITTELIALGGGLKLLLWFTAAFLSRRNTDAFFTVTMLALFDIGNATLLAIGRYHTGQNAALSSRYQYEYLVTFLVILAIVVQEITRRSSKITFTVICIGFISLWWTVTHNWPETAREWSKWRGRDGLTAVRTLSDRKDTDNASSRWIGFPAFLSDSDIQLVRDRFNLTPRVKKARNQ